MKPILKGGMGLTASERIVNFREYMSKDQSMGSPGTNRAEFYDRVITQTQRVRCRFFIPFIPSNPLVLKKRRDSSDSTPLTIALEDLGRRSILGLKTSLVTASAKVILKLTSLLRSMKPTR